MGQRTLYPKPDCPGCGHWDVKVSHTYYTKEGEILRNRKCYICEASYWTLQAAEHLLPDTWTLKFPKKFTKPGASRLITIERQEG